ncbi:HAMP domain-containing sensor histidine kinase [Clostridium fallax]|uniref:histidine kinase n=1 Tax=Clostridium fallax TaxID=1533 RepID=A0A1M4T7D9_9CLOT|nr:sensor histidine kinase [Clostridium fallax]SHE40389.1 Signal transduction histidine kinase [Clostridium fallax]SQB22634.1 two-component system signal transduction histidine kinase [Clostridium fallax]
MDIKWKNNKLLKQLLALIILSFCMTFALAEGITLDHSKRYFGEKGFATYLNGYINEFRLNLVNYFYDTKEKDSTINRITKSTFEEQNQKLKDYENSLDDDFDYRIREAENSNNLDQKVNLIHEKNDKLNQYKAENYIKSEKDIRANVEEEIEKRYDTTKGNVEKYKNLDYLILNTNSKQYMSNLEGTLEEVEDKIKKINENQIEFIFDEDLSGRYNSIIKIKNKEIIDNDGLKETDGDILNIYIRVHENIKSGDQIYIANSLYKKLIDKSIVQGIILLVSVVFAILTLFYINKNNLWSYCGVFEQSIRRLWIEFRILGIILLYYFGKPSYNWVVDYYNGRFIESMNTTKFIFMAICILMTIYLIRDIIYCKKNNIKVNSILYKLVSNLYKLFLNIKKTYMRKSIGKKFIIMFLGLIIIEFIILWIIILDFYCTEFILLVAFIMILFDILIFIIIYRPLSYLDQIITDTENMAEGNLDSGIEERGKGQLSKLAHNINNLSDGLRESISKEMKSERLKSELITNVSHDLKTPLTSIINYVDLLKKEEDIGVIRDYIEILDRKSQRLKLLIQDLFEVSKASSGALDMNIEKIEINSLLKQTLAEFDDKINNSKLDFKIKLQKEKIYVMADGKKTWRVFENLISNILKYSLEGSRVYITLDKEDDYVKIAMKNISSYEMDFNPDEISERFKRADDSRNTEGSGLGLAIAKSFIELQKGYFNIDIDGDLFKAIIKLPMVRE